MENLDLNNYVIKVFIGFDKIESVAWHTMAHSIFRQSSKPVAIIPVYLRNLKHIYKRQRDERQSNEFSFSRFLIPYLCNYQDFAIYFDCDMLIRTDINDIFEAVRSNPGKAVYVVKHDYNPKDKIKALNKAQYSYPRKNWSSVVLWNCAHPSNKLVTPDFVNNSPAADLHRFLWLKDEEIGELDIRWNWLVGEYDSPPKDVKNVHWTVGGPYVVEYQDVDFAEEWLKEKNEMEFCEQKG